jgi:hypothetical protein
VGAIAKARKKSQQLRSAEFSPDLNVAGTAAVMESEATHPCSPSLGHHFGDVSVSATPQGILQRAVDDDKTTAPDNSSGTTQQVSPGNNSTPTGTTTDSQGSTTIEDPTVTVKPYSGASLADVQSALPDEAGLLEFDFNVSTTGDPATNATLKVKQMMTLPKWVEREKQCPAVQKAWDDFASALRQHEDGHVAIDKKEFASAHTRFVRKNGTAVKTESDQLRADVLQAQDDYDTKTDHGRKGNPPTIIDLSVQCEDAGKKSSDNTTLSQNSDDAKLMTKSALSVGAADDPYEQEADRVAAEIVSMETPTAPSRLARSLQRKMVQRCSCGKWLGMSAKQVSSGDDDEPMCEECEGKRGKVQRKATGEQSHRPAAPPLVHDVLSSGGRPLDRSVREYMEPRFGFDFSQVRVHTDEGASQSAQAVNALAYTVGGDVVFANGRYAPETSEGRRLLAHELTHVVQQIGGASVTQTGPSFRVDTLKGRGITTADARQIQRDAAPAAAPSRTPVEAKNLKVVVGEWGSFIKSKLTTTSMVADYDTEDAAIAVMKSRARPAVLFLETGRFVVYDLDVDSVFVSFKYENTRAHRQVEATTVKLTAPGSRAVATSDSVILRGDQYMDPKAAAGLVSAADWVKPGAEDPLLGYTQAYGAGLANLPGQEEFLSAFHAATKDTALRLLQISEREAQQRRDQFQAGPKYTTADELSLMRDTAKTLADLDRQITETQSKTQRGPHEEKEVERPEDRAEREAAVQKLQQLQMQRVQTVGKYPMLARVDVATFKDLSDDQMLSTLGDRSIEVLRDISATREYIAEGSGAINLWAIPSVIEATIAGLGIQDKQRRDWIAAKVKAEESAQRNRDLVLGAFIFATGVAAAAATVGGLAAAPFLAAAAFGSGFADAMLKTRDISVGAAAANTNMDPRAALIAKQGLSGEWVWLAIAWASVVLDIEAVVSSLKLVSSGISVAEAAERLATKAASGSKEVVEKLKIIAGIAASDTVISTSNLGAVSMRVGRPVTIAPELGSDVTVLIKSDSSTGQMVATELRVGPKALVNDIIHHRRTVQTIEKYSEVATGARGLKDRLSSIFGARNPVDVLEAGSPAFEAWLEVDKLPGLIDIRRQRLLREMGKMSPEVEEQLWQEIEILESELEHYKSVVNQLAEENSAGFVAMRMQTNDAAKAAGYPDLDWERYYYVRNGSEFVPRSKATKLAPRLRIERTSEGKLAAVLDLPTDWSATNVASFDQVVKNAAKKFPGRVRKVVAVHLTPTSETIGSLMTAVQKNELFEIIFSAVVRKGGGKADRAAMDEAAQMIYALQTHNITIIRGTDELRQFGYSAFYEGAVKGSAKGDLHHVIPLYLGGDHRVRNLLDLDPNLHDQLHNLIDNIQFTGGLRLAPESLQALPKGSPAAAVIFDDGAIEFEAL